MDKCVWHPWMNYQTLEVQSLCMKLVLMFLMWWSQSSVKRHKMSTKTRKVKNSEPHVNSGRPLTSLCPAAHLQDITLTNTERTVCTHRAGRTSRTVQVQTNLSSWKMSPADEWCVTFVFIVSFTFINLPPASLPLTCERIKFSCSLRAPPAV